MLRVEGMIYAARGLPVVEERRRGTGDRPRRNIHSCAPGARGQRSAADAIGGKRRVPTGMRALRCGARYKLQKSGNLRPRSDAGLKQRLSGISGHAANGRARTQLAVGPTLSRPEEERTVSPDRPTQGAAELVLNSEGCPFAATGK